MEGQLHFIAPESQGSLPAPEAADDDGFTYRHLPARRQAPPLKRPVAYPALALLGVRVHARLPGEAAPAMVEGRPSINRITTAKTAYARSAVPAAALSDAGGGPKKT